MTSLAAVIRQKFPSAIPQPFGNDYRIQDDGNGPQIAYWNPVLGPLPTAEDIAQWTAEYVAPAPIKHIDRLGIIRFTVTANVVTTTSDAVGISGVLRVSAGRYRIYYDVPDDALTWLPGSPTIMGAVDLRARVTRSALFTEIRIVNAAGTATDIAELILPLDKVV